MAAGGEQPRDVIRVDGTPPITATISGGIHGDQATYALIVNAIPRVMAAPPGLLVPIQLPVVVRATRV